MSPDYTPQISAARRERLIAPDRLLRFLVQQGPVFVKIGQYLSLRPDVLPKEYCDALLTLTDCVPPFPFAQAEAVLAEDLPDGASAFTSINPEPFAAGSLAQVHQGILRDGTRVAVKIQRPGIAARVDRDLHRLARVGRWLDLAGVLHAVSMSELMAEVRRWLQDELNFRRELANTQRLFALSQDHPLMRIPRPYPELSGERIVTMELMTGVSFADLLSDMRRSEPEGIIRRGLDRNDLAEKLLWSILDQIFRFEFFHADPHPGNLLALPGNQVCFLDFGLVETVTPLMRRKQIDLLSALYGNEFDRVFRALRDILEPGALSDLEGFRREFLALSQEWSRDKDVPPERTSDTWPVSRYMAGVMRAARQHRLRVPAAVLSLYRALFTGEIIAHNLGSQNDLRSVGVAFFQGMRGMELMRLVEPGALQTTMLDVFSLIRDGPGNIHRVLSDLADERLTLAVRTAKIPHDQSQANNRSRLTAGAIALLANSVLIAGAPDVLLGAGLRLIDLLWGVEIALGLLLLVIWRRLS